MKLHKLAALTFTVLAASTLLPAQSPSTVLDGVYTEAQAARGQASYVKNCARCHTEGLDGGGQAPALRTFTFLDGWREDNLSSLFLHIQTRMPPGDDAGTLPEAEYIDIVSHILEVNKFPAGKQDLTRAALDTTLLVALTGPQPLPASATVRAVGCLAREGSDWNLTRATSPARVRNAGDTDDAETARSTTAALGTRTLHLLNLEEDHPEAELRAQVGKKVQVKGVFNGEGATGRIYALSFTPLGQTCQ